MALAQLLPGEHRLSAFSVRLTVDGIKLQPHCKSAMLQTVCSTISLAGQDYAAIE